MKNKTNLIFLHKLLKAFADSIIKIFIPLYILKTTNNIKLSFLYLITYTISTLIFMFILKRFLQKYGIISIILHCIPIITTQFLLTFYTINVLNSIMSGVLMGLSQTLYSIPLNLIFAFSDKETNVAKFEAATNVGKILFVLLSGFLISSTIKNSFLYLSILASLFYISCVIPILYSYNLLKNNYNLINKQKKLDISKKDYLYFNIFHIVFGSFQSTMDNVLPLYLYINNLSFESVSIIIVLIELCKILANYFAKYLTSKNKYLICTILSFSVFLISSILILIFKNAVVLYILSCLISVTFPLTFVPMFKLFCKKISADNYIFDGMTNRDFYIFIGKIPLYSCYFVIPSMYSCFAIGIVSSIIMFYNEYKITTPISKNNDSLKS